MARVTIAELKADNERLLKRAQQAENDAAFQRRKREEAQKALTEHSRRIRSTSQGA
jgi:hypothetical protein